MAQEKKYRLKGHETFILREGWLAKGVSAVAEDSRIFSKNYGTDALGVGTNMAKAIRYWLRESGLTEENTKDGVVLSSCGQMIYDCDRYFEDEFTLWLIHINLAKNAAKVTSWYIFFNLLESEEFNREELFQEMKEKVLEYSGETKISERSLGDDCTAILNMYCHDKQDVIDPEDKKVSPFAHLGLLRKNNERYRKVQPDLNTLAPAVIHCLLKKYSTEKSSESFSIDDLLNKTGAPGKLLQLNRVSLNRYLDMLADEDVLEVTRTAGLDMVYLRDNRSEQEIMESYYQKGK